MTRTALCAAAALLAAPTLGRAQYTPPTVSNIHNAAEAAAALRNFFFIEEQNDGAELGGVLVKRYPNSGSVRAWYVANLARIGETGRVDSIAARIDTTTRDPWLIATRAFAKMFPPIPTNASFAEAHRLALKARSFSPRDSDLAWIAAYTIVDRVGRNDSATVVLSYVDSVAPSVGYPTSLRLKRAQALYATATSSGGGASRNSAPDTAKTAAAMRELAAVRAADPTNLDAFYTGARWFRVGQPDSALALIKRAVAIAPRSPTIHHWYWITIDGQRALSASQKQTMIGADYAAFLTATDSAPWALAAAAEFLPHLDPAIAVTPIEDHILARVPRSSWSESILLRRAQQWRDSIYAARDTARPGLKSDTIVARRRYIDAMEAFIAKPWVAKPASRGQAVLELFAMERDDRSYPTDKMVMLIKELFDAKIAITPDFRYGEAAKILAERRVEPALAERAAREGLRQTAQFARNSPNVSFSSVGDEAEAVDRDNATLHDALALVFSSVGRYGDADREMAHAVELTKKDPIIYRDLGRLRATEGRNEEAELAFAQGMTLRSFGVNPNQKELEAIYLKNHGGMDGWASYLGGLVEKEKSVRRANILGKRDTNPKAAPPFKLADLRSRLVDSDSLRGKYVVVNFWGTWCGPCVAEMPELQQFYEKYRGDSTVAILTISNDKDLQVLEDWVSKRKFSVPTLFDDGYVANSAHITAFPTTWFIAPDGRAEFSATGNTGALVEEWTWRLEAMRKQQSPKAVPVP